MKLSINAVKILLFISLCATALPAFATSDLNQQIDELAKQLTATAQGVVLKGSGTKVYINLGQQQGVLAGTRFEIVRPGEPLKIDNTIIGYEESFVAEVEVDRARDTLSICRVVKTKAIPGKGDKVYQLRKKINSLVVGQFTFNQSFNALTKSMQEKLVTAFTSMGMKVVERSQLERVLKEQKLGYSGLVDLSSAKKIGKLLGAEGLLLGTISDLGDKITINARMVDIETGKAISASEVELYKTPLITQLMESAVHADESYASADNSVGSQQTAANSRKKSAKNTSGGQDYSSLVFKNDLLIARVKSTFKSKDKKTISIAFSIKNTTDKDLYLSVELLDTDTNPNLILDDYRGLTIRGLISGLPYVNAERGYSYRDRIDNYGIIYKNAMSVFVATFQAETPIESTNFSLFISLAQHEGKREGNFIQKIPISFYDIAIK